MGTTTKGFWFPDGSDNISPLHPVLGAMQASVDNGLNSLRFDTPAGIHRVTDAAGMTTLVSNLLAAGYTVSSSNPAYAFRADTQLLYENKGSGWSIYRNIPVFANTTARDSVLPSPVAGTLALVGSGSSMQLTIYNGTAWRLVWTESVWQSYTPTWSGITLGNGSTSGRYVRHGNTVHWVTSLTFGSSSAITGLLSIGVPISALDATTGFATGWAYDASGSAWKQLIAVPGNYILAGDVRITSTVPWTWAVGDLIKLAGTYETNAA